MDGSADGDEAGRFVVLPTGSGLLASLVGFTVLGSSVNWVGSADGKEDGLLVVASLVISV